MHLYIDTAQLLEVAKYTIYPWVHGVTTNPLLLAKPQAATHQSPEIQLDRYTCLESIQLTLKPQHKLMIQIEGSEQNELFADIERLEKEFPQAIIKIPFTSRGVWLGNMLIGDRRSPICYTAIFSAAQAILAAMSGAAYVAPYIGRMRDANIDPWNEIELMQTAFRTNGWNCRVLAASLRTPDDIAKAVALGCDVTVRPSLLNECFHHPETEKMVGDFQKTHQHPFFKRPVD